MAAPHVAGAVALMASVKTLAASKVVQLLRSSANPLPSLQGLIYTGATLDAYAAVIAARDFIQTYSIVGTVISSGLPLSGVTLTLSEASATATTSAQGTFTFPSIADGTTVTIVPSLVGYSFSPAYRTGRISQNSQADFTAILVPPVQPVQPTPIPLREVKGTVSAKGKKVSGSTVTLKAKSGTYQTKTKSKNGKFTFIGISEGTYQLSIQDKKHKFKPRTFDILVVGGNTSKSFKAK